MLSINSQQFSRFDEKLQSGFVDRLVKEAREHYAETYGDLPDSGLRLLVESGLVRATAFGFQHQSSLATFVHMMFGVAPNFYAHPAVRAALADTALPLEDRMEALPERVDPSVWDEIVRDFDATAW